MKTVEHLKHIASRTSFNDCPECRADTERRFVSTSPWSYQHVADYLRFVRPRLDAIRYGEDSTSARVWLRQFRIALNRRITEKVASACAERKRCDSYLERMRQFKRSADSAFLRRFAARGASGLDR